MVLTKKSKRADKCNLKQTDICAGIANLRELSIKQNSMSKIITCPIVIYVSSDEDDEEIVEKENPVKVKVEVREEASSICSIKPKATSTPLKNTDKISIIQHVIIPKAKTDSFSNTSNNMSQQTLTEFAKGNSSTEVEKSIGSVGKIFDKNSKSTIFEKSGSNPNTSSKKSDSTATQKMSSPKKEKKGINKDYLKINNDLISSVLQNTHLNSLLSYEDKVMLRTIQNSNTTYQYVSFKLYKWLPKWYKLSKFVELLQLDVNDKEIVGLFEFLHQNDIVETDYTKEETEYLLNLLTVEEVKKICTTFKMRYVQNKQNNAKGKQGVKTSIIKLIMEKCSTQSTLTISKSTKDLVFEEIKKCMGKHVVKLKENFRKAFRRVFILATYADSGMSDINEFYRQMLESRIDFPDYDIQYQVVFYSKSEFNRYVEARDIKDKLDNSNEPIQLLQLGRDIYKILKNSLQGDEESNRFEDTPHLRRFTAKSLYTNILTKISEKVLTKFPKDAKEWLEYLIENFPNSRKLGDWYLNLSRICASSKNIGQAAKFLITALKDKRNDLTELQIENLADRGRCMLKKMCQLDHDLLIELLPPPLLPNDFPEVLIEQKTIRGNTAGQHRRYEVIDSEGNKTYKYVEDIALDYYIDRCGYTNGSHCEGSIIKACFLLFFWDIIYTPEIQVPGTFLSDKQTCPIDMFTPYFYPHRKQAIDERLEDIAENWSNDRLLKFVKQNWRLFSHKGSFFDMKIVKDEMFLENVVECIGRRILAKIFERLVKDVRQYRSGMPDLLVWNVDEKKAKFVEVKGENDKLSIKQKMWLRHLKSIGANLEVCHVHSIGSKKKIIKKEENVTPKKPSPKVRNKEKTKRKTISSDGSSENAVGSKEKITKKEENVTPKKASPKVGNKVTTKRRIIASDESSEEDNVPSPKRMCSP